jgi:hypothetical protein
LTLYPHQLRALHRCLLIENDGNLAKDFGAQHDYRSRGGCLADAVGMGKTVSFPFPFLLLHHFETFRRVSTGAMASSFLSRHLQPTASPNAVTVITSKATIIGLILSSPENAVRATHSSLLPVI